MRSSVKLILSVILAIQFSAVKSFAKDEVICNQCIDRNADKTKPVEVGGELWILDDLETHDGVTMWRAHPYEGSSSSRGDGMPVGNVDGPNGERITGRDFSRFEDSDKYSKKERQALAEFQQKVIARLNNETGVDSEATNKELDSQIGTLNDAVRDAGELSLQGPGIPSEMVDPMFSLYDTLQVKTGPDGFYPDKGGWRLEDNHPYQSDHKDQLEDLKGRLNSHVPTSPQQADAKRVGYYVIDQADKAYSSNQPQLGEGLFEIAKVVVDIATDIIPVTSIPKDLYRAVIGKDPMTGEALAGWERAMAGGFAVGGIFGLGAVKVGASRIRAMARAARVAENDLALAARVAKSAEGLASTRSAVGRIKNSLSDVKLLNPVKENNFLTKVFKYSNKAWDERKVILQGKTKNDQKLVRFFSKDGSEVGNWVTPMDQVVGKTPEEIREILALKHAPGSFTIVDIPAGTEVTVGFVSPNEWGGKNGAIQYFLPKFENKFFGPAKPINNVFRGL
jgi:hypothetical protein